MKILLIRHGESEADILNVHEGRADFELTESGQNQVLSMAKYLNERYNIDKIYSSTLKRAFQTASCLSKETGVSVISEDKLMEFNNGLIAGLSWKDADEKYPLIQDLPLHKAVYEQESKLEFRYRAEYVLSKIISETKENETVAIVSHGGMINQLFHVFLKLPIETDVIFTTGDAGVHEWLLRGEKRIVIS